MTEKTKTTITKTISFFDKVGNLTLFPILKAYQLTKKIKQTVNKKTKKETRKKLIIIPISIIILFGPLAYLITKQTTKAHAWWNNEWEYRKEFQVSYSGEESLTEYQVLIDGFDTASLISADKMQDDCDDIRLVDENENNLNYFIVGNTCNSSDTEIWVKTETLDSDGLTVYLYYGNTSASSYQNESSTFSYSSEKTVGYILGDRHSTVDVISLEDSNSITHNGTTRNLNDRETSTFTASNYGAVTAKKLFQIDADTDGTDIIVPVSWAGTEFIDQVRYASSGSEEFFIISPWGSATVNLYVAGVSSCSSPWTVTNAGTNKNCPINDDVQYRITSDIPILVFREGNTTDPSPLYPATTDYVYGFNSYTTSHGIYISAGPDGADYRYIDSDTTDETNPNNLGANKVAHGTISGGAAFYSGPSLRVYSINNNIGVTTKADGDGGDSTTFVKRTEFGTEFGSANPTDFIAVVSDQTTTCTVYDANNSQVEQKTLTSSNSVVYNLPSSSDFGRGNSTAFTSGKWTMTCTKPVYAFFQNPVDGGERNMWSYPMMRQFTYPTPSVESLQSEEEKPTDEKAPKAHWKLDEGYGTQANDSSGNTYQGTISGATWRNDVCVSGNCLNFDGQDDKITVADSISSINSIAFWIKPSTTTEAIMELASGTTISISEGAITTAGITDPTVYINGHQTTTIEANNWSQITITTDTNITANAISIGNVSTTYLKGFLDEIKLYDYKRTQDQVKTDTVKGAGSEGSSVVVGESTTQSTLSQGLVGYWKMDETSSPSIDSSGNGNSGTWAGTADDTAGKYGNAINLDGSGYINLGSSNNITGNNLQTITISTWIKTNSGSAQYPLTLKRSSSESSLISISSNRNSSGETSSGYLGFVTRNQDNTNHTFLVDNGNYNDGSWHHVTAVVNNSTRTLYIDGVQKGQDNDGMQNVTDNTADAIIGAFNSSLFLFNGQVDEARIYNRALSPQEVKDLYNWAPGPIQYWELNKGTSSTIYDSSGNDNTGSFGAENASPQWTIGKFGKALKFDGVDDYVNMGTTDITAGQDYTVSLWVKPFDISASTSYRSFFSWSYMQIGHNNGGNIVIYQAYDGNWGSGYQYTSNSSLLNIGSWTHITMRFRNNQGIDLYVNGVYIGSDTTKTGTTQNVGGAQYLGSTYSPVANYFTNAVIDEVKIYDYARTQKQIIEDMNANHPIGGSPVGSQVLYYKFDEGYGDTAYDTSPQQNNGNLQGTCPGDSTCPTWTSAGKYGKALSFDGGDYITTTDNSSLDLSGNGTISLWIKPSAGQSNYAGILVKAPATNDIESDGNYYIMLNASDVLRAGITGNNITTSTTITADQWQHLLLTWNGSNVYFYKNLELIGSTTQSQAPTPNNTDLYVGKRDTAASSIYFNGSIDEVKIYNSALTEDEIKLDYNQGKSLVLGSTSTDSSGNPTSSSKQEYCPPGNTEGNCAQGQDPTPVAEWKMDEKTGTSIYDTSNNNNTGSFGADTAAPAWTSGKIGGGLSFDGNDYIDAGNDSSLYPDQMTISTWVNFSNITGIKVIASSDDGSNRNWALYLNPSGLPEGTLRFFVFIGGSSKILNYSFNPSLNTWYHLTGTADGSNLKLYINGALVGTPEPAVGNIDSDAVNIKLGVGSYPGYFTGKIDQVRIYDYARTQAQIAWDYNKGKPVAWYKLDECQGETAYDSSGNGNNGTITIGATEPQTSVGTCTTSGAWYNGVTGKFNSSLNFDGTDDYITTTDIDTPTANTISLWFKPQSVSILQSPIGKFGAWELRISNSILYYYVNDGTDYEPKVQFNAFPTTDTWYHIAAVMDYDETNIKKYLYINGERKASEETQTGTPVTNNNNVLIGQYSNRFTNGQIDDVQIYNYSLSEQQIKNIYNQNSAVRFGPSSGSPN